MNEGWIKLHRKLSDHEIWLSDKFSDGQAWIDLILLANHKDSYINKRGIRFPVLRGGVGWSEIALAKRWKWSRGKVRRFVQFLVQQNMIETEQQNNKITTYIQIINYDKYQDGDTTNGTTNESTNGQQTDNKRYRNKNEKNEKNEKNKHKGVFEIPEWIPKNEWDSFVDMRKEIKKPMTEAAKKLALSKLGDLKKMGEDLKAVLNQSIYHNWQGLFAVKKEGKDESISKRGVDYSEADEINRRWREAKEREAAACSSGAGVSFNDNAKDIKLFCTH